MMILTGSPALSGPQFSPGLDPLPAPSPSGPVPIPYPNFSSLPTPLAMTSKVLLHESKAHGFSNEGIQQAFVENKVPSAMPDLLTLSRVTQSSSSLPTPSQSKVIVEMMAEQDSAGPSGPQG